MSLTKAQVRAGLESAANIHELFYYRDIACELVLNATDTMKIQRRIVQRANALGFRWKNCRIPDRASCVAISLTLGDGNATQVIVDVPLIGEITLDQFSPEYVYWLHPHDEIEDYTSEYTITLMDTQGQQWADTSGLLGGDYSYTEADFLYNVDTGTYPHPRAAAFYAVPASHYEIKLHLDFIVNSGENSLNVDIETQGE